MTRRLKKGDRVRLSIWGKEVTGEVVEVRKDRKAVVVVKLAHEEKTLVRSERFMTLVKPELGEG